MTESSSENFEKRSANSQALMLSPLEAAYHLGITTELLFQYTKKNFSKTSGMRSLKTVQQSGTTKFLISELDNFDVLLSGPWPKDSDSRSSIPKAIVDHLRAESFNQCSRCGSGIGVQTAHIEPWATSRSHHHANLIRICKSCHSEHDDENSLPTNELVSLKKKLVERTRANLTARMNPVNVSLNAPRPSTIFVGRECELSLLIDALQLGRSVIVTGSGGIGKTELLVHALQRVQTGRPVFWIETEKYRSSSDIISTLQTALAKEGTACPEIEIPSRLDALQACVVFDGIENALLNDLDRFEDTIAGIYSATSTAHIVATSQVSLYKLPFDSRIEVGRLDLESSQFLLQNVSVIGASVGLEELSQLVDFCEGHALTLRIAAALMDYYGGPSISLKIIKAKGAAAVNLPGRSRHDRKTSLEICLQIAYDALSVNARLHLWVLSELPAGIWTNYLVNNLIGLSDSVEALAELRRWHLVEIIATTENIERTRVLAPIRAFAIRRASMDDPNSYENVLDKLAFHLEMTVAVFEIEYNDPDDMPYVLKRYGDELPNFLHTLDLAHAHPNNTKLVKCTISIVSALMGYYFVLCLLEDGARAMRDAGEIAIKSGHLKSASGLTLQSISLAARAESTESADLMRLGLTYADRLEKLTNEKKILADMAMCRAIVANASGKFSDAERYVRNAYHMYRSRLRVHISNRPRIRDTEDSEPAELHDLHNDISYALGVLGNALLAMGQYETSSKAYHYSLQHQRGSSIAVNRGQTYHQIGNCQSQLGNFREAASNYIQAAIYFHYVGMVKYLSSALGELGYTLLDAGVIFPIKGLEPELIECGLIDLGRDVKRVFNLEYELDHNQCIASIRKVFGCIALISLVGPSRKLGSFCNSLYKDVILVLNNKIYKCERKQEEGFPVLMINTVLRLGHLVSEAEQSQELEGDISREVIGEILGIVCNAGRWAQDTMRLVDWLGLLLTSRWCFQGVTTERVREFITNFNDEITDYLDLSREGNSEK